MEVRVKRQRKKLIGALMMLGLFFSLSTFLYALGQSANKKSIPSSHHTNIIFSFEEDALIINGIYCMTAEGESMQPTFFSNNILCFRRTTAEELSEGNIIHYQADKEDIAHRVVSIDRKKRSIVTQGDNNIDAELINFSQVRGVLAVTLYS